MSEEPPPRLLHEIFARAARRYGDLVAIDVSPGLGRPLRQTRTYRELQRDADAVSLALGPDRGERTAAILLARDTPWLYAAQLGAMQSGFAYVALEARFPDEHLRFVLEDAAAKVVLTDAQGAQRLQSVVRDGVRVIDVATLPEARDGAFAHKPFADDRLA